MKRLEVLVLALLLTACGSHTATIDQHWIEGGIKVWAEKQYPHTQAKVQCPADVPIKAGSTFHCIVTDQHRNSVRVTVTIENDKGYVTWVAG